MINPNELKPEEIDRNAREFLDRCAHFYYQRTGEYSWPNSCEGDLLKMIHPVAKAWHKRETKTLKLLDRIKLFQAISATSVGPAPLRKNEDKITLTIDEINEIVDVIYTNFGQYAQTETVPMEPEWPPEPMGSCSCSSVEDDPQGNICRFCHLKAMRSACITAYNRFHLLEGRHTNELDKERLKEFVCSFKMFDGKHQTFWDYKVALAESIYARFSAGRVNEKLRITLEKIRDVINLRLRTVEDYDKLLKINLQTINDVLAESE